MRDVLAGLVALCLLLLAILLAGTLRMYRRRREAARQAERARGRTIIAELPTGPDLLLFSEDRQRYYYGGRAIEKDRIRVVRVLINGAPITAHVSRRARATEHTPPSTFQDRAEPAGRDQWGVAIETDSDTILIDCGAIREGISQELATRIFEAVRRGAEEGGRPG